MSNRIVILLVVIVAILAAAVFTIARANSGTFVHPPDKQTLEAHNTQVEATSAALWAHVTKIPDLKPMAKLASCPLARTPEATGIVPLEPGPFGDGKQLDSEAIVISGAGNIEYWVWAGAPDDYPGHGMIRVITYLADPCVSQHLGTPEPPMTDYITPKGPLTITKIEGDLVDFSIAGGGSGRFNLVTDQFLP